MSDESTTTMVDAYFQESGAPRFLSSFFRTPPQNFYRGDYIEIDVVRDDEDVAVPVQSLKSGSRESEASKHTNKRYSGVIYDELATISASDLPNRRPGVNPFADIDYMEALSDRAFREVRRLENKIRRGCELQASQVFQTGELSLVDSTGAVVRAEDFFPKTAHFPTAGTTWATTGATGTPLSDLESLAQVLRANGKRSPDTLIFGSSALQRFLANTDVQARISRDGIALGAMAPAMRGEDASFQGYVWVGAYRFEMWAYDGYYKHPQTGTLTPYVGEDNVIMLSSRGRYDMTFGEVPLVSEPDPRVMAVLPSQLNSSALGMGISLNAYFTEDNKHLKVACATRALAIPTAIDTFGCLDVTA